MGQLDIVRRGISRPSSAIEKILRTVLAVGIPTVLRWAIDGGDYGTTIVVYLPAILMIAIYLGREWGALALLGSVAAMVLMPPLLHTVRPQAYTVSILLFAACAALMVVIGHYLRVAVVELQERSDQAEEFNRELQHRTKNALQMMRALASRATKTTDPAAFYEALSGRLGALAKANELLRFGALEACELRGLVEAGIAPFSARQIEVDGPNVSIRRDACTPLMMALHELCTNATKYGALSCAEGKVTIRWHADDSADEIDLHWTESGGPPVKEPEAKGFGSRLLVPNGLLTCLSLEYPAEGVRCRMTIANKEF